jgi:hypothetical protein
MLLLLGDEEPPVVEDLEGLREYRAEAGGLTLLLKLIKLFFLER